MVIDPRREAAARNLAHEEADHPIAAGRSRERVATDHSLQPLDADIRELAGLVRHRLVELNAQMGDVVRELPLLDDAAGYAALGHPRREVDGDADVGPRNALAGQDVALVNLVCRQEIAGLGELLHRAGREPAFARAAAACPAAVGELDSLAQGRLQDGLAGVHRDRLVVDLCGDDSLSGLHRGSPGSRRLVTRRKLRERARSGEVTR